MFRIRLMKHSRPACNKCGLNTHHVRGTGGSGAERNQCSDSWFSMSEGDLTVRKPPR